MSLLRYFIRRILWAVPVVLGVTAIVLIAFQLVPGDIARQLAGKIANEEQIQSIREKWGLDQPIWVQYIRFIQNALTGDLGYSMWTGRPVVEELWARFPATIELSIVAMVFAIGVGIPLGIISAYKQHTVFDYLSSFIALIGVSMPIYWLALMMQQIFAVYLGITDATGRIGVGTGFFQITNFYLIDSLLQLNIFAFLSAAQHLILPGIALGTIPLSIITRMMRSSMIEELRQDYIVVARAKGRSEFGVVIGHALRNAFIPTATVIGLNVGYLFSGAVLTETIFAWPGVGFFVWNMIGNRDYTTIMGFVFVVSIIFVVVNLLTDFAYLLLDPRIIYEQQT